MPASASLHRPLAMEHPQTRQQTANRIRSPRPVPRVEWCQTRILQWLGLIGWFDATSAPLPGTMRRDQAPPQPTEEHLTGDTSRDDVRTDTRPDGKEGASR